MRIYFYVPGADPGAGLVYSKRADSRVRILAKHEDTGVTSVEFPDGFMGVVPSSHIVSREA